MKQIENPTGGDKVFFPRIAGLDIIRCVAIFTIVGGHFFMNTAFMQENYGGVSMFLQAMLRQVMCIGVPLVLLCSFLLSALVNPLLPTGKKQKKAVPEAVKSE